MAFPVGVTTRNVAFSSVTDAEDGTIYPVRALVSCNEALVHIPTGVEVLPSPQFYLVSPMNLPVTDQVANIWANGEGKTYVTNPTHSYHVELEYQKDGKWYPYRTFPNLLVPTGAGDLDINLQSNSKTYYNK